MWRITKERSINKKLGSEKNLSLKEKIFGKKSDKISNSAMYEYFKMFNGYSPVFTTYEGGLYEMDLTRSAVKRFADHCSKLKPEVTGTAAQRLKPILQYQPNFLMNTSQFLARIATIFECDNNCFIVPIENSIGEIIGYYPILPSRCEVLEAEGQLYLRYTFNNGEAAAIEFERVGILNQFQYEDDLFGEDNAVLKPTMQLLNTTNEGIINAVKNSAAIRFVAKMGNILKPEDLEKERARFTAQNLSADNKSGVMIFDTKYQDIKQVDSKPYNVDDKQMQQIKENVYNHFGTNEAILQNKYNENEFNAYYEGKIEPFAIQLSLVMSNMTFTEKQKAFNNSIFFSANRLQYASNQTKLQVSSQLFDRGVLSLNGVFDIWNLPHVEGGDQRYIRKEYAEIEKLNDGLEYNELLTGENNNDNLEGSVNNA